MRIGIVTTWQERGAAYVSRQYRDALQQGHQVFIYARGGEAYAIGDRNWDDSSVTWGKKIPIHVPMAIDLEDFSAWIRRHELDTVFFNEQQWWDPVLLCRKLGLKIGTYIDYYTPVTVPFFRIYDFLICHTKRHQSVFSWHPGAAYVPWGTDLKLFKPQRESAAGGPLRFFHSAGRSPERKGTDLLLKAFARVQGPAKLIIHSQGDIKAAYPELSESIDRLTGAGRLEIYQETVSAPGLYHLGDVYAYPSRLDGLGLSLPEALACGLALITSDNPPMNEFCEPAFSRLVKIASFRTRADGYYWPLGEPDEDDLLRQLQYYVDNPGVVAAHQVAARTYAEANLDWEKNGARLAAIFSAPALPAAFSAAIREDIEAYENARSNRRTRLYRAWPALYKPFAWLWPLLKKFYQE